MKAFIKFTAADAAEKAIELMSGQKIDDTPIKIEKAIVPHTGPDHQWTSFESKYEREKRYSKNWRNMSWDNAEESNADRSEEVIEGRKLTTYDDL